MPSVIDIKIPDIGEFHDVDVVEVMVKPGDRVSVDDSLITIESDKATMEVPTPQSGIVKAVRVKLGDKVSEGSAIIELETEADIPAESADGKAVEAVPREVGSEKKAAVPPSNANGGGASAAPKERPILAAVPKRAAAQPSSPEQSAQPRLEAAQAAAAEEAPKTKPHASPSVRKFARELGADLNQINGSGPYGRIFRADVERYVKSMLASPPARAGAGAAIDLIPWPQIDFTKFGTVESVPLSRIRKLSKANLARNWVMIPHVTQFDEADVTELEEFRRSINQPKSGAGKDEAPARVTILAFVLKALVPALIEFPEFNSSLDGDNLILKKYFNLGFAADTPDGLVVPVIRDVDQKGVLRIARETGELAAAARGHKLKPSDMQGGCFTVSSLGGIGGTAFTPIINAPEVAILGVSKQAHKPVYQNGSFVPRLILPLSLSYDHRVIDGALAARFITFFAEVLGDMRRALL
ncbi:MAG: dihydrolipoyllysine-residue acetyltransferase [Candidatus Binataceae bacterium]|jgi:pyruvate dehydrogenase E2 component (dihydrolipoamide acetyltransferase)